MNRRSLLLTGLILVTCIVAALLGTLAHLDPARAWSPDETAAAQTPGTSSGIGAAELVDARRAAGEAASSAGLLTTGTGQLVDGATELDDASGTLIDGVTTAKSGADELSGGLTELQAGVGQLGVGATEIADGVAAATEPLVGLGAVRGQIISALDRAITSLQASTDSDLVSLREDLEGLRSQAETIPIDDVAIAELERLRDGSRELANQLAVPGYAFHDGIYTATQGAADLAAGLGELESGAGQAGDGVAQLREGAEQIDTLATQTDEQIDAINRAIPVVAWEDEETGPVLAPQLALLIAAFGMLGGLAVAIGVAYLPSRRLWLVLSGVVGISVAGLVALLVFATSQSLVAVAGAAGVLALSVLAAAGATRVLISLAGAAIGSVIAGVLGIVQLGVVGWVWRVVSTRDVATWLMTAAELTPLHWATTALTALGNDGDPVLLAAGAGVLGVLAVIGAVSLAFPGSRVPRAARC